MQNSVQTGKILAAAATRSLSSGDGMLIGSLFGVATGKYASGADGEFAVVGVYSLPKTAAQSWSIGDPIYWDNTNFRCDNTDVGMLVGVAALAAENPSSVGVVRLNAGYYPGISEGFQRSADATVTSAQVLALNAVPRQVVAAPGEGKAIVLDGVLVHKPAGTAYAGIAAGEDLAFKYTNGSGALLATMETTGFLDQSTAQTRFVYPTTTASFTPADNAPIVAQLLIGEIITGTSNLLFRAFYRVVPTALA